MRLRFIEKRSNRPIGTVFNVMSKRKFNITLQLGSSYEISHKGMDNCYIFGKS